MRRGTGPDPLPSREMYLIRGNIVWPVRCISSTRARRLKVDAVGKTHELQEVVDTRPFQRFEPIYWDKKDTRWVGPKGGEYHSETDWKSAGMQPTRLGELTIKTMTKAKALAKFKPPNTTVWRGKIGASPWNRTHKIRAKYVTPRDKITWMKIWHRNLWTAHVGGMGSTQCATHGCHRPENQEHLVTCNNIREGFWKPIQAAMIAMNLKCTRDSPKFWLTGILQSGKAVDTESAAFMFWAWRALYAESVSAHLANRNMNLKHAYGYTIALAHARIRAHGYRWRTWYVRQRYIARSRTKAIPQKHQKYKLFRCNAEGEYEVHTFLRQERARTMQD
jgi:hypothetical protein